MKPVRIAHLYPAEMNIYGDRGNIITLVKRLAWRGWHPNVDEVGVGDKYDFKSADIIFGGGGQDRGQSLIAKDLQSRAQDLQAAAADGVVMLTICGTYQLFGHGFLTKDQKMIPGIGLFGAQTRGSDVRMIGNLVVQSEFGELVGFENHSGQTILEPDQQPLGRVIKGYGNNDQSGFEGAAMNNVFGCYLHGPVLPKNPQFADGLILRALHRRYDVKELKPLDNELELRAAAVAKTRPR